MFVVLLVSTKTSCWTIKRISCPKRRNQKFPWKQDLFSCRKVFSFWFWVTSWGQIKIYCTTRIVKHCLSLQLCKLFYRLLTCWLTMFMSTLFSEGSVKLLFVSTATTLFHGNMFCNVSFLTWLANLSTSLHAISQFLVTSAVLRKLHADCRTCWLTTWNESSKLFHKNVQNQRRKSGQNRK